MINSAIAMTVHAWRVQILTSSASLAFSMILSFCLSRTKSVANPLNLTNHPGIQSLNYRGLGALGVLPGAVSACGSAQPLAMPRGTLEHASGIAYLHHDAANGC